MRVGVLGCGYWGSKHVRVLQSIHEVSQTVVIDASPARRLDLKETFPAAATFESLDDALAADAIDALVVATPPTTHASMALRAIEAGIHTMIEKPMATSSIEALSLVWAAEDNDVVLMSGHTFEYNAAVWRLREAVQRGELGTVHYLDSARLNLGLYQSDVNVLWDLAPHDVSLANFVLGEVPHSVTAWGSSYASLFHEDVALLRLDYPSGVMATIRVSWLDPCKVRRTTVVGSEKMAVYNDMNDSERIKLYDRGVDGGEAIEDHPHEVPMTYRYGDVVAPFIDLKEPLLVEDEHFVRSIIDRTEPNTTGRDGLLVVRILEAANRSLAEGRTIELPNLDTGRGDAVQLSLA